MKTMKAALLALMVFAGGISSAQASCQNLCGFSNGIVFICDTEGKLCRVIIVS